jgi:hypothetical protein
MYVGGVAERRNNGYQRLAIQPIERNINNGLQGNIVMKSENGVMLANQPAQYNGNQRKQNKNGGARLAGGWHQWRKLKSQWLSAVSWLAGVKAA